MDTNKKIIKCGCIYEFLKKTAERDIRNLFNFREKFIVEAFLIQVKQCLIPLINKDMETISDFLYAILNIIKKNPTLGKRIALCNNMVLQNMYKNISNRSEVTKEKIKNSSGIF